MALEQGNYTDRQGKIRTCSVLSVNWLILAGESNAPEFRNALRQTDVRLGCPFCIYTTLYDITHRSGVKHLALFFNEDQIE